MACRKNVSTHTCFRFMLQCAQSFGMLPVSGITNPDYTALKFKWTAKRTLYSILFLFLATLNTLFQLLKMIRNHTMDFQHCVTLLFFTVTAITVAIFIDIARNWPALVKKWTEVDTAMASYGFPRGLQKQLKVVTVVVITAAIAEHSLFLAFALKYSPRGATFTDSVRLYFVNSFDQVFAIVPYHIVPAIFAQILNSFSTVSWNFMDLFIMLVSLSLSARFTQVMKRLCLLVRKKEKAENVWRTLRDDYTRLTFLCATVDDVLSTVILVSFGNNIFVVLVQLYFSLERPPSDGALDKIYYLYSFTFLVLRTIAVALYAATINSESKKTHVYLNSVTCHVYNAEIERFLCQTKYETIALSGHKLFKVTKSLILSVAGAIVTYELVLIQFNVG